MAFDTINPRPVQRYRAKVWKSFTWVDLVALLLLGLVPSVGLIAALNPNFLMMFTVGFLPLFFAVILVIPLPNQHAKLYSMLGRIIAFYASKRKYSSKQTSWLNPYESFDVEAGLIKLASNKSASATTVIAAITQAFRGAKATSNKIETNYVLVYRVRGFNLATLSEGEAHIYIDEFRRFVQSVTVRFSIVAKDEPFDLAEPKLYLNSLKLTNPKLELALSINKTIIELFEAQSQNEPSERGVFFAFTAKREELLRHKKTIEQGFENMGLHYTQVVTEPEAASFVGSFYGNAQATSLAHILSSTEPIKFSPGRYEMSGKVASTFAVERFPSEASLGWIKRFMDVPKTQFVVHLTPFPLQTAIRRMDQVVSSLRTADVRKYSEDARTQHELDLVMTLAEQVQRSNESLFSGQAFITGWANTTKELREVNKDIQSLGVGADAKVNSLSFYQFEGFEGQLPKSGNYLKKVTSIELPSMSVANSFPFDTDFLNDKEGIYLGFSVTGANIFFNPWILDHQRKNHNGVVLGTSGSGKSTALKKLIKDNLLRGVKVILLDPQREYQGLTYALGGEWLNLGTDIEAKQNRINPLEFFQESEKQVTIAQQISILEGFFLTLFPEISHVQLVELNELLRQLYINAFAKNKTTERKSTDYPLLSDLAKLCQTVYNKASKDKGESERIKNLYELNALLQAFRSDETPEAKLWNGHTNIDVNKANLVTLDIHSLNSANNTRLVNAQMHLILKLVMSQIITNRAKNIKAKNVAAKVLVGVDEAHLLISQKRPAGLQFLYEISKTIRKFNGGLWIITQNINDLLNRGEEITALTSAVLNNSQYALYFNMQPDDLKKLGVANSASSHQFSPEEIHFITTARKGDALFAVSANDRKLIHIDVAEEEMALWKLEGEA